MQELHALGAVSGTVRLGEQRVVLGVTPVRVVVAVARREQLEKRVRVGVIADPAHTRDLEILRLQGLEEDLPFLVLELDLHAEVFPPHLLQGFGDLLVALEVL